jgi:hypothetical protein
VARKRSSEYHFREFRPVETPVTSLNQFFCRIALPFVILSVVTSAVLFAPPSRVSGSSMPFNVGTVLKSVVFLFYPTDPGLEVGTGFLVQLPSKTPGEEPSVAIVTARHLVDPKWAGCKQANPPVIFARVNTKNFQPGKTKEDDAVDVIELPLGTATDRHWYANPRDRVDIAVIPVSREEVAQFERNDTRFIPVSDFATAAETENYKVGIGDQIVTAGLVPALLTTERNYPAFKFGRISNIPAEPIDMMCTKGDKPLPRDVWLLAGNFVGGNSGSPVYLLPSTPSAQHRVMLIGIIAGDIPDVDLGQMVPSEFAFDILKAHYPNANLFRGHAAGTIMK